MIQPTGDATVPSALDAIEAARKTNGPGQSQHVLANAFRVHPDEKGRAQRLNAVFKKSTPVVLFLDELTEAAMPTLSRQRTRGIAPVRSLLFAGETVSYGSDRDNIPEPDPGPALQTMITREHPAQSDKGWSVRGEAVDLITELEVLSINGAYRSGLKAATGSTEVSKDDDLVVLDQVLMSIPATDIHKTRVLRTLLGDGRYSSASEGGPRTQNRPLRRPDHAEPIHPNARIQILG